RWDNIKMIILIIFGSVEKKPFDFLHCWDHVPEPNQCGGEETAGIWKKASKRQKSVLEF
ncbi:hypothetical protein ACJX0J_029092, partial [Zea mays]